MLKHDAYEYDGQKVTIFELSGMQRIDYLSVLEKETSAFDALPKESSEADLNRAFAAMRLRISAWLVAASIWHQDESRDFQSLLGSVLAGWSGLALTECSDKILALSGMTVAVDPDEETDAETVSVEKP